MKIIEPYTEEQIQAALRNWWILPEDIIVPVKHDGSADEEE